MSKFFRRKKKTERPLSARECTKLYENLCKSTGESREEDRKCLTAIHFVIIGLAFILIGIFGVTLFVYFEQIKVILQQKWYFLGPLAVKKVV